MASTFGTRQGHRRNSEEWRSVAQDKKFALINGEAVLISSNHKLIENVHERRVWECADVGVTCRERQVLPRSGQERSTLFSLLGDIRSFTIFFSSGKGDVVLNHGAILQRIGASYLRTMRWCQEERQNFSSKLAYIRVVSGFCQSGILVMSGRVSEQKTILLVYIHSHCFATRTRTCDSCSVSDPAGCTFCELSITIADSGSKVFRVCIQSL